MKSKPGPKPRRRADRELAPAPVPADPMHLALERHLEWMQLQNFSRDTVTTRRASIGYFIEWCRERAIAEPSEVTRTVLERYQRARSIITASTTASRSPSARSTYGCAPSKAGSAG